MAVLSESDRVQGLEALDGWTYDGARNGIVRTLRFADFGAAFAFMTKVADVANEMDHHPEWLNVYNTVEVTLSTHDAGGLTELDIKLAEAMDRLAG